MGPDYSFEIIESVRLLLSSLRLSYLRVSQIRGIEILGSGFGLVLDIAICYGCPSSVR
jgi:hypothetical protein